MFITAFFISSGVSLVSPCMRLSSYFISLGISEILHSSLATLKYAFSLTVQNRRITGKLNVALKSIKIIDTLTSLMEPLKTALTLTHQTLSKHPLNSHYR